MEELPTIPIYSKSKEKVIWNEMNFRFFGQCRFRNGVFDCWHVYSGSWDGGHTFIKKDEAVAYYNEQKVAIEKYHKEQAYPLWPHLSLRKSNE